MPAHFDRPDAGLRLLILLARLTLSEAQRRAALDLCRDIPAWNDLANLAERQFLLPLVYRHLHELAPPTLSPDDAEQLRQRALGLIQRNLLITAEQQRLVAELLEPLDIPYLFFKGPALAARYYDEPAMRSSRDIDLLVPPQRCVELLELAFQRGYRALDPETLTPDRQSLAFAVRTQRVVSLVSPGGVCIEFHHDIDRGAGIYQTDELLEKRVAYRAGNALLYAMPTCELFVYICLHHTRHFWSHLHWLVDLDAIQRHPDFDAAAAHACAERRGLASTVNACMAFYQALAAPEPEHSPHLSRRSRDMLEACLATLQGGQEAELALRRRRPTPEFGFPWQTTAAYRRASRVRRWVGRFQPEYIDYALLPLPSGWQWLYYAIRPCRALTRRGRTLWPGQ
ncbi:nucleotidyltransferase domain-containing protein [Halomonas mongoliensis]|uniref:Nucleotidyltransferase family protein n=1 Tax=Halomonas mongoliensis TaxID=321265 RepID=A0ABU1GIW4_9GAMM|nr:nucleotidyltransferase family protein [Halomonas mongoliensis]MDR5891960.1 nucleotidyltransferase family protein [Halomonas mongoliensis]